MKSRRFLPVGIDALEDRLVMTAFSVPFTLVTPPSSQVNPKNLVVTNHTEAQISRAITASFSRATHDLNIVLKGYLKAASKAGLEQTAVYNTYSAKATTVAARLSADLLAISRKLPFGGVNLDPVLVNRITGTTGVVDTTTKATQPSLETRLRGIYASLIDLDPNLQTLTLKSSGALQEIQTTEALVRGDINNYINLGVTNGYFKLGKGATLPTLS